jgi:nucleotide-binding universal stress UspA family protein
MRTTGPPVLVGVTGSGENTDALRFAVGAARTRGCGVTLVHAVHPVLMPPPPSVLITDDTWTSVGRTIVEKVRPEVDRLLEELPAGAEVPVSTVVRQGGPGLVLGDLSKDACLVVLQRRDLSRLHRVVSGSAVAAVAAHARCPVVSVPSGAGDREPTGLVTAGVHGDGGPPEVLEAAFAEASARSCGLRLLHGWRLEQAYDHILSDVPAWTARDEATITVAARDLAAKYPEVQLHIDVRHDWPADVLAHAGAASDLLVVGRHSGLPLMPHRLGSLARTAVAHAPCPVMVVPV